MGNSAASFANLPLGEGEISPEQEVRVMESLHALECPPVSNINFKIESKLGLLAAMRERSFVNAANEVFARAAALKMQQKVFLFEFQAEDMPERLPDITGQLKNMQKDVETLACQLKRLVGGAGTA
jgi:hypothetical protein